MYTIIMDQLSNPKIAKLEFSDSVFTSLNVNSFLDKMSAVNALETVSIAVKKGNIKDYEKLIFGVDFKVNGQELVFTNLEVEQLARYLKRTYSKLSYSENERPISHLVQIILSTETNPVSSHDAFESFLKYGDHIFIEYIKLFMLYANTDKEFRRIAEVLISKNIDVSKLAFLNSPDHDKFISDATYEIKGMSASNKDMKELYAALRKTLKAKYETLSNVCSNAHMNTFAIEATSEAALGMYASLLGDFDEEEQEIDQQSEEIFNEEIIPELELTETITHVIEIPLRNNQSLNDNDSKILHQMERQVYVPLERQESEELQLGGEQFSIFKGIGTDGFTGVKELYDEQKLKIENALNNKGNKISTLPLSQQELVIEDLVEDLQAQEFILPQDLPIIEEKKKSSKKRGSRKILL